MPRPRILLCDDDREYKESLKLALQDEYDFEITDDGDGALEQISKRPYDVVLLDIQMRTKTEGFELLPKIKRLAPWVPVVIISGLTDFHSVLRAMREGAIDYLPKEGGLSEVREQLRRVLTSQKPKIEAHFPYYNGHVLIGNSECIEKLRRTIFQAMNANKPLNTVIRGEPGSGKEVVARMLGGVMRDGKPLPFKPIDSSTIHPSTAESILFGHEKGAFTGADRAKKGLLEEANGGTVYFDEISNMSLEIQAKLLRVIQEKEILRLGASNPIPVEFRVICATNRNLEEMISKGQFRDDLYTRLNVLSIEVPPLRAHAEDIPLIIDHFVGVYGQNGAKLSFSEEVLNALNEYFWPGNVRELSNLVEYLCAMHKEEEVRLKDIPLKIRKPDLALLPEQARNVTRIDIYQKGSFYDQMERFEKDLLESAYKTHKGNVSRISRELKMDRSHCYEKLRKHGIHCSKVEEALQA